MKKIILLGATGSIGLQTLDVCKNYQTEFELIGLSAGQNIEKLKEILKEYKVQLVCTAERQEELENQYPNTNFFYGEEGLLELARFEQYDMLVNALTGFAGLKPTLAAIENKKDIALANKETLVVAGELVYEAMKRNGVCIMPIDSEHSAIFQCLQGNNQKEVKRLILTASGGAFRDKTREELETVTVKQALAHPTWKMGAKITIDSATMMNKGFEVIEAHWLYDIPFEKIDVIIHPQSIIHSMVEYVDHSILAQLGESDMRIPIQYAMSYPRRLEALCAKSLDFTQLSHLEFKKMDLNRYPLLKLAYEVGRKQGTLPAVMNAASEEANHAFLRGEIRFLEIEEMVIDACKTLPFKERINLEDIIKMDQLARQYVQARIRGEIWE